MSTEKDGNEETPPVNKNNNNASKKPDGETKWVDAWIRWPEDENKDAADNDERDLDDDDDDEPPMDPFAPDPQQVFSFSFPLPEGMMTNQQQQEEQDQPTIDIALQGYTDDSDQAWNSTGLTLWRAAEHLCRYLVAHSELLHDKRILELGAGLGLCGILAHQLCSHHENSSSHVVVTDGDTDALAKLRENVDRHKRNDTISCRQLLWGRDTTQQFLQSESTTTEPPPSSPLFDVLLASDIVYVDTILPPLFETVQTLLRKPNGMFVFAYCSRRQVPVTIDMVLEQATKAGFSYKLEEEVDGIFVYIFQWEQE